MRCSTKDYTVVYNTIDTVPNTLLENLNTRKSIYFSKAYLKAIEIHHPEISFLYLILKNNNKEPIAFATLQIVNFYTDALSNTFETVRKIGQKLNILKDNKPLKLMVCGNVFASGPHGLLIGKQTSKKEAINNLAKSILNLKKTINADAYLLKDFNNINLELTTILKELNYNPFSVEPNMQLNLSKDWVTFNDYLAAMKTKFRVKAKKAYALSKPLNCIDVRLDNASSYLEDMNNLYIKVANNANFNLGNFNINTYKDLKANFKDNYLLKVFVLNNKVVGFMSGIINSNALEAHFVGIDYSLNKQYAIYQKMLYTYIEVAIAHQIKTINFGRTASEIKSSVGAVPEDLTIYIRHKKTITNKILQLFLHRIEPTPFKQKQPFKHPQNNGNS